MSFYIFIFIKIFFIMNEIQSGWKSKELIAADRDFDTTLNWYKHLRQQLKYTFYI